MCSSDARSRGQPWPRPSILGKGIEEKKKGLAIPCARATRGLRRPSLDARTMGKRQASLPNSIKRWKLYFVDIRVWHAPASPEKVECPRLFIGMIWKSQKAKELARSRSDITVRDEVKEGQADTRPQGTKNRRRIRWNTLRIFWGREQSRCLFIIRRSRRAMSDRLQAV